MAGTLLKLTVAATFVIELPATALILAPWRPLRVLGAALQAFLQVGGTTTCFAAFPHGHGPAQACWPWEGKVILASALKQVAPGSFISPQGTNGILEAMVVILLQYVPGRATGRAQPTPRLSVRFFVRERRRCGVYLFSNDSASSFKL